LCKFLFIKKNQIFTTSKILISNFIFNTFKQIFVKILIFVVIVCVAGRGALPIGQANYPVPSSNVLFVSPSGSDSAPGTLAQPLLTIGSALSKVLLLFPSLLCSFFSFSHRRRQEKTKTQKKKKRKENIGIPLRKRLRPRNASTTLAYFVSSLLQCFFFSFFSYSLSFLYLFERNAFISSLSIRPFPIQIDSDHPLLIVCRS
jgi:hypothetical protein